MEEDTKYIGVRVPVSLYIKLKKIAHEKQGTLTDIAIEAFNQYTSNSTPGLCSHCHTQNPPEAKYCISCGLPMTNDPDSLREFIRSEIDAKMENLSKIVKAMKEYETREDNP